MNSDLQYVCKDDLLRLSLADRLALGLHLCQGVFRLFTPEYVQSSCQSAAMIITENFLETGRFDDAAVASILELFGEFYEGIDEGPYRDYGSGWGFAAVSLLEDLRLNDGSSITAMRSCALAFGGIQMFRQNLSPFDPVFRSQYSSYADRLTEPVFRSARELYDIVLRLGVSAAIGSPSLVFDLHLPRAPEAAVRKATWTAPPKEYENLKQLGLVGL